VVGRTCGIDSFQPLEEKNDGVMDGESGEDEKIL